MMQRFAASLTTGILVTFSLLWIMQILIATGKKALVDETAFDLGDFIMVKQEEIVNKDENEPEPPPEVEEAPPDLPPVMQDSLDTSQSLNITTRGRIGIDLAQRGAWIGEGDYLPIVKINPIYPRRATTRGLEGQCLMEFTVTSEGGTKDVRVVECTSSLFQRASINAVVKWKYKPRVQNGKPVEVPGVQHIITFELED